MIEDLRAMVVFARTAELGSFRGAAQVLGLSPSVVSHHVAALETRLGVALLYRSTRALKLTDDGEKLLAAAQAMIAAAERGLGPLRSRAESPVGRLSVAAPAALIAGPLMDDLADFARTHPQVELSLSFSDVQVDLIGEGVDVALRAGTLRDAALRTKKLFTLERRLVAAPALVETRPPPTGPATLAEWPWIRLRTRPPRAVLTQGAETETVAFEARVAVDSAAAMHALALRGLGLATLPSDMVASDLAVGRLVEVLPAWRPEAPGVYAVWPANAPADGLTARFIDSLERKIRQRRASGEP